MQIMFTPEGHTQAQHNTHKKTREIGLCWWKKENGYGALN